MRFAYLVTYPVGHRFDEENFIFGQVLLSVAILIRHGCDFVSHDPPATMPALFSPTDTTITQWFGVGCIEVPTPTLGAHDASLLFFLFGIIHRFRFL